MLAAPALVRAQATNGIALVIGNSKYRWESSLPNVRRDAPDVAKRFQAFGLKTELLQDAGQDAMRAAIDKFASASRGANFAAFYFAGHGASWDKNTYLVSEDADLSNPSTVQTLLPVGIVNAATREASNRLLVFDSCRNNPADGWRQRAAAASSLVTKTELAATALQGPNTLVIFSTAPGRVAVDGPAGENSPFAAAFLRQLAGQSVDLQALPAKLRRDLLVATEGRQVLWDQSTYNQPFLLTNTAKKGAADPAPLASSAQIVELPNAYAFAKEKGLLLPPGLVVLRHSNASAESARLGSFKTAAKVIVGGAQSSNATVEPMLLIVLSVSDTGTAEIIVSSVDWQGAGDGTGRIWRYMAGEISGPRLSFTFGKPFADASMDAPHELKWSDANSGRHSTKVPIAGQFYEAPLSRLD